MARSARWLTILLFFLSGCAGEIPAGLGLRDGRLAACPQSPNCVASQEADVRHHIDALVYNDSRAAACKRLQAAILALPRATVVTAKEDYLHATFASTLFGFVDDAEFYLPADRPVVEVRSAARSGWSDFGVNRKRLETLRTAFTPAP
jgi:uncharacterized protein (DUF1499 family)